MFQQNTGRRILEAAKRFYGEKWIDSPLYKIHLDLLANVGIKNGESAGELSDMFVEK